MKALITLFYCLLFGFASMAQSKAMDAQQNWRFKVYLDDSPIGYHQYTLKRYGDTAQVDIKAEFDVRFMFFSVYDYLHENLEVWQGECLSSLSSTTDDNGENVFVKLSSDNESKKIKTPQGTIETNGCVRSFAYWDPNLLQSERLLNAQTGELVDVEVSRVGADTINLNQQPVEAERYRIKGEDINIDVWYSPNQDWLALQSVTEGGYVLRYERESKE